LHFLVFPMPLFSGHLIPTLQGSLC